MVYRSSGRKMLAKMGHSEGLDVWEPYTEYWMPFIVDMGARFSFSTG